MPVGMLQGGAVKVKPHSRHGPVLFLASVLEAGEPISTWAPRPASIPKLPRFQRYKSLDSLPAAVATS